MERITKIIKEREGYKKLLLYTSRLNEDSDPSEIIETSKATVEAICRTILGDLGHQVNQTDSFLHLLKETMKALPLIDDMDSKDRENVKKLVNGIVTFSQAAGTLRNKYSMIAHGQDLYSQSFETLSADMMKDIFDVVGSYLLRAHFGYTPYDKLSRATYGDYKKFDNWFDENYQEEIKIKLQPEDEIPVSPSEALFYCDREAYKSQLVLFKEESQ